jgi:predicted nicotinamide N-methyase
MKKSHLKGTDLMVGADICFWDEMIDPLSKLVNKAMKAGVHQVVLADPGRPPFDEVCERAQKKWGAKVKEWEVTKPTKAHGWLLIIGDQA